MPWDTTVRNARSGRPTRTYNTVADVQGAQDAMTEQEREYGDRGTEAYLGRAENFDATSALNKYASGAWGSIEGALKNRLTQVGGAAVGAGRFDSGFFDEDQGTVINEATNQFSNAIAQQSMNALGAEQRNTESLGAFGNERSGRAIDLTLARSEQVQNDAREEAERRRRSRGGIGAAIGGALGAGAGFMVGGPAGAQAGMGLGSGLGGAWGGR